MSDGIFRFAAFTLDPHDRQLRCDGVPVELNARYFDALWLLVRANGGLVTKAQFLSEVWRGVPVTDEALTQCIRTLRRQLGDEASRPRFIQTEPKHGYRFIAPVERVTTSVPRGVTAPQLDWETVFRLGRAGLVGGGAAGLLGGIVYGSVAVSASGGSVSSLMVIACLTLVVGLLGGAGVGFGIGAASLAPGGRGALTIAGGAAGGLLVGAVVKMVGLDAFDLLFGQSPGAITGAPEGALLGAALGLGFWLSQGRGSMSPRRSAAVTGACGAVAGLLIGLLGGHLMGGSLDLLADHFPQSSLQLDHLGRLFGERDFGRLTRTTSATLEAMLFGAGTALAMARVVRRNPLSGSG